MIIIWKVTDGFEGNGDHELKIPDEEFEDCDTEEIEAIINDYVRDEFDNKVGFDWRIKSKPTN